MISKNNYTYKELNEDIKYAYNIQINDYIYILKPRQNLVQHITFHKYLCTHRCSVKTTKPVLQSDGGKLHIHAST